MKKTDELWISFKNNYLIRGRGLPKSHILVEPQNQEQSVMRTPDGNGIFDMRFQPWTTDVAVLIDLKPNPSCFNIGV
jgi:hypothetical protein